jgi:hypothetical protein
MNKKKVFYLIVVLITILQNNQILGQCIYLDKLLSDMCKHNKTQFNDYEEYYYNYGCTSDLVKISDVNYPGLKLRYFVNEVEFNRHLDTMNPDSVFHLKLISFLEIKPDYILIDIFSGYNKVKDYKKYNVLVYESPIFVKLHYNLNSKMWEFKEYVDR